MGTPMRGDLAPKKSLGQNFMVEESVLGQMADSLEIDPGDTVLEIGAGLGALTAYLAARARRVVAVEIDRRYVDELRRLFADQPQVEIVQADILKTDLAAQLGLDAPLYRAAGNLPYYITSAIIRQLLESQTPPRVLVITVQYEVAQRIVADPPDMSLLSVSVQFYGRPEILARIAAASFYPRPNVDSALVRIRPHQAGPPLPPEQRRDFFRVVRAGFSQPRKQLKNSLAAGLHLPPQTAIRVLTAAGIDPTRRAETLTVPDWVALHQMLTQDSQ